MTTERRDLDVGEYIENSPFVRLFGTKERIKIIDVLLRKGYTELTASEVSALAKISPSTFHRNIDMLMDSGLVSEIDNGTVKRYQINNDNSISKSLRDAQVDLLINSEQLTESYDQAPSDLDSIVEKAKNHTPTQDDREQEIDGPAAKDYLSQIAD